MKPNILECRGLGFVIVPKCGGTSIKTAVREACGLDGSQHIHADDRLVYTDDPTGLVTIAFIRNPFDRLVSVWANKVNRSEVVRPALRGIGIKGDMPFDKFVDKCSKNIMKDGHIAPQVSYVPSNVDNVLRFENIKIEWRNLQHRFKWLPDLNHMNRSSHSHWEEYYDHKTLKIAESMYQEDLALWRSI